MLSHLLQQYHTSHRAEELFANTGVSRKAGHVQRVAELFRDHIDFFLDQSMDPELAIICAEHHDDGRLLQYEKTGQLNDHEFSHQDAGTQMVEEFCIANGYVAEDVPEDVRILSDVMKYHGKLDYIDQSSISLSSIPYIRAITAVDELENSMSCVSYLKRNYYQDEKGLSFEHSISPEVWHFYETGTKFDKMKLCHTYDEYILFAGMLAINSIKKYGVLAQELFKAPGFGYDSILDGFRDIFYELLLEKDAEKAYQIMRGYVYA